MIKKIILLINLLPIALVVNSEITNVDEKFTLLCVDEKSTGFNWKKGDWHQTNFITGQKYIIKKHDKPLSSNSPGYVRNSTENRLCAFNQRESREWTTSVSQDGCYSIKEFGKETRMVDYTICREDWSKDQQSKLSLKEIFCKKRATNSEWIISPNEWFHRSNMHSNLDSDPKGFVLDGVKELPDDYKDSLSISVGKCSEI